MLKKDFISSDTIFSIRRILDRKETLEIGRKLDGFLRSSPSRLRAGKTTDLFCESRRTLVSVCFSCTHISRPLDLQGDVCARGAGVPGCLGDRLIRLLRPWSSFRALCTGALSISLQRASVEVAVRSM